jgi:hypothetical protein
MPLARSCAAALARQLTSQPVNRSTRVRIGGPDGPTVFSGGIGLFKYLEVVVVIVLPLVYGLAVSGFFHWLHLRRTAAATAASAANGNGIGIGNGTGAGSGEAGK